MLQSILVMLCLLTIYLELSGLLFPFIQLLLAFMDISILVENLRLQLLDLAFKSLLRI